MTSLICDCHFYQLSMLTNKIAESCRQFVFQLSHKHSPSKWEVMNFGLNFDLEKVILLLQNRKSRKCFHMKALYSN